MLERLLKINKYIIKINCTSILTGALLFSNTAIFSQDSTSFADTNQIPNSSLLVKNDTTLSKSVSLDTNFTENDTAHKKAKDDTMRVIKYRSPKIAGLYSAIIPGLGQAYNHKYWKIPFVYAGGGVLIGYSIYYNNRYNEYKSLCSEEYFYPSIPGSTVNLEKYKRGRDFYRKKRDRLLLFTGLLYAANIVDAIVDAYFTEFDISDNLSLKVTPVVTYPEYALGNISCGMSLRLNF
jgi:hypothetical protein